MLWASGKTPLCEENQAGRTDGSLKNAFFRSGALPQHEQISFTIFEEGSRAESVFRYRSVDCATVIHFFCPLKLYAFLL